MKRVTLFVLLVALLPALLGACGEAPTAQPTPTPTPEPTSIPPTAEPTGIPAPTRDLATYDVNEFFVLEYPAAWETVERETTNAVLFLAPTTGDDDLFRENIGVLRQELEDESTTVGDYTREFLAAAPELIEGYQLVTSEPTRLAGLPAHRVIYGGSQNGMVLGWLQVWTISGGNAYILTYTGDPAGFETFLGDAEAIIASFTLR